MTVNTSRLGIFELIGYLFSGIYVVAVALVLPLFATGVKPDAAELLVDLNASVGVALIAVCYVVGIITSRLSMAFYNGIGGDTGLFPTPEWYPFKLKDDYDDTWEHPSGMRRRVWKWADSQVQEVLPIDCTSPFAGESFSKQEKEVCETAYHYLAYTSSLVGSIDRIASVVRFTSSVVVASITAPLVMGILGIAGFLMDYESSTPHLVVSGLLFFWCVVAGIGAYHVSKEYADSYWSGVIMGILTIPSMLREDDQASRLQRAQASLKRHGTDPN